VPTDEKIAPDEVRAALEETLPAYMIPSFFVPLDALPLTVNGKVDRAALPDPRQTRPGSPGDTDAPETETERKLAAIWRDVLGIDEVGRHDNFVELGGDSILNIQIVARAGREGMKITPRQVFDHPTIATLAEVATTAIVRDDGPVSGPVPLTPIQHWFFELGLENPDRWNHAVTLRARTPIDAHRLQRALDRVLDHHDMLRARYSRDGTQWTQSVAEPGDTYEHAPIDIDAGVLVELEVDDRTAQLAIHHLAVDAVSWPILLEDIEDAYTQLGHGSSAVLPRKSSSFKTWAEHLDSRTRRSDLRDELPFWRSALTGEPLPRDGETGAGATETVRTSFTAEETRALMSDVPKAFDTTVDEALLTALVEAFRDWTGRSALSVFMERHGRETEGTEVDLSRTVGWFTALFPMTLNGSHGADSAAALRAVKEQVRAVPRHGLGYGVLRYLGDDDASSELRSLPAPEVLFNYLGRIDAPASAAATFELVGTLRLERDANAPRPFSIECNAFIQGGDLHVDWTFDPGLHFSATMERVTTSFSDSLRRLIRDVSQAEGGLTPSDFPDAGLNQDALDDLLDDLAD
jgi:non-ribosomal peptide synthase protein (TIGR01720 family)